ncbi:pectinesterase inhibitor 2-like [Lotus japonicus]|uniref:pectinesterase inhibitor 2-like n=1 Tax=Lotus japonicus TaxID=34305 RepID=UPI0025865F1D|nr:pectinesterase inhibitor 2-like [Lotus japonicus]
MTNTFSSVLSSLVLAFILFVASSDATNKIVDISEICKTTVTPSFCSALLNSSPGGKDLVSLSQYIIDVDRANVTNTITLLKSLIPKSKDPKLTAHYKDCLDIYGEEGALGDVDDIQRAFKMKDYLGMNIHASALFDRGEDCISGEFPGQPGVHDPSLLPKYAFVVKQVTSIILVLSNDLRGA